MESNGAKDLPLRSEGRAQKRSTDKCGFKSVTLSSESTFLTS